VRIVLPSRLLRIALVVDAVVTGAVALQQVTMTSMLSSLLSLPRGLILETGIFLVAYTLLLAAMIRSQRLATPLIVLIIAGNIGWAMACIALLAADLVSPTTLGIAFVMAQAIAVLAFAGLQWAGLRRSQPA
jgi:hypothetical protein